MIENIFFLVFVVSGYLFYAKLNVSKIPEPIIVIYKNPIFKFLFLILLYLFGNKNIILSLFLAVNYIGLGQVIQYQELMHNI